jgi:hypothetical protein
MAREIHFSVQQEDVTQFEADVLGMKYVEGLFGASQIVAEALGENDESLRKKLPSVGSRHLFHSQQKLKVNRVLFLSVPSLATFDYRDINQFGHSVLRNLQSIAPDTQHLALTVHGIGLGLNPANSLRSELGGCIEAIKAGEFPPDLEKITVIDKNPRIVNQLKTALSKFLPSHRMEIAGSSGGEKPQANSSYHTKNPSRIVDVFISYKSEDTEYAKEIYEYLASQNFEVFFSKESLPQLGSDEYHEQIDIAIERARNMVVVASTSDNVMAKWVKYEWRLFLGEKLAGRKPGNLVTVIAGDMKIEDLPIALRNREVIALIPGEFEKLQRYIGQDLTADIPLEKEKGQKKHSPLSIEPEHASQVTEISNFFVAKTEIVKDITWNEAIQHAKTLSIGGHTGWELPTLEQLAVIRNSSLLPDHYCYWSIKEAGTNEAFYIHFDDGHIGRGPKTFNSGLNAIFVRKKLAD